MSLSAILSRLEIVPREMSEHEVLCLVSWVYSLESAKWKAYCVKRRPKGMPIPDAIFLFELKSRERYALLSYLYGLLS